VNIGGNNMNTRISVINDAFLSISENMGKKDAFLRYLLTAFLIGILLAVPPVRDLDPITIAANYLFTTTLMRWDPIYALFGLRFAQERSKIPYLQNEGDLRDDLAIKGSKQPVNDSHQLVSKLEKTG
jgi:hypothetical protein